MGAFTDDLSTIHLDKCLPIRATCIIIFDINKAELPVYVGNPATEKTRNAKFGKLKGPAPRPVSFPLPPRSRLLTSDHYRTIDNLDVVLHSLPFVH